MKHVYKSGGNRKDKEGREYTVEAVNLEEFGYRLDNGWFDNLNDCLETGSDYEKELREQIKALGGKAGGRSTIKTLEKQLKALQDEQ